jgi:hypothetical protein
VVKRIVESLRISVGGEAAVAHRAALFTLFLAAAGACRASSITREPGTLRLSPVFGPIVGSEVIGGRADDGHQVWLLVGQAGLVHVDVRTRRSERAMIRIGPADQCWGLARLDDGSIWTLRGRNALVQVAPDGAVVKGEALAEAHLGLFGASDRLVYQVASFAPPGPALRAAVPGGRNTVPWSEMTTRTFDGIARASAVALNMVACGGSARKERPCWFPHEAAVSLIDAGGATRRVSLPGLTVVPPEILLTSENPALPVRDAYLDRDGNLWVLSTGTGPPGGTDRPGGWILARYRADGQLLGLQRLTESARLILYAEPGRALLLTGDGMVAEVIP